MIPAAARAKPEIEMNVIPPTRRVVVRSLLAPALLAGGAFAQGGAFRGDSGSADTTPFEELRARGPLLTGSFRLNPQEDDGYAAWDETRPDRGVPLTYDAARLLDEGELLVGYRFEYRRFKGLRDSRHTIHSSDVFDDGYTFAPTEMTVMTHRLETYYGFDDSWTFYGTLPIHDKEMDVDLAGGGDGTISSSGLGDLEIGALMELMAGDYSRTTVHLGLGIPTGSIDEEDDGATVPYVMQLGTGTFDFYPGLTQMWQDEDQSCGFQTRGRIHVDQNSEDYAVSDSLFVGGWYTRVLNEQLTATAHLDVHFWGDYHGASDSIDPDASPVNEKFNQGGSRIDLFVGGEWDLGEYDREHRLGLEFGVPIDEWLDGPQLATHMIARLSWRIAL